MTPAEIRHRFGRADSVRYLDGSLVEMTYGRGPGTDPAIVVYFDDLNPRDRADEVDAFVPRMHTAKGIHPGSSARALRRAYGHAGLRTEGDGIYMLLHGKLGSDGEHDTDFLCVNGRIFEIDVETTSDDLS